MHDKNGHSPYWSAPYLPLRSAPPRRKAFQNSSYTITFPTPHLTFYNNHKIRFTGQKKCWKLSSHEVQTRNKKTAYSYTYKLAGIAAQLGNWKSALQQPKNYICNHFIARMLSYYVFLYNISTSHHPTTKIASTSWKDPALQQYHRYDWSQRCPFANYKYCHGKGGEKVFSL